MQRRWQKDIRSPGLNRPGRPVKSEGSDNTMANRIPRKFNYIIAEALVDSNAYSKGMRVYVFKDDLGYLLRGFDNVLYRTFASHIRDENALKFIAVR